MLTYQVVVSFLSIAVLLALAPGPDNLFVLMQSALWGKLEGLVVVFGLCTGLIGHTIAVAVGLAAIFATSATAFTALKLIGAGYLVYLAWGAFRAPASSSVSDMDQIPRLSYRQLYGRGIIMNLTNPKVSLFFLAFLPQFTSPAHGSVALQILSLGALFMLATLAVFGAIAFFSGAFGQMLRRSDRVQKWLNWAAGTVFIGLALRLLFIQR